MADCCHFWFVVSIGAVAFRRYTQSNKGSFVLFCPALMRSCCPVAGPPCCGLELLMCKSVYKMLALSTACYINKCVVLTATLRRVSDRQAARTKPQSVRCKRSPLTNFNLTSLYWDSTELLNAACWSPDSCFAFVACSTAFRPALGPCTASPWLGLKQLSTRRQFLRRTVYCVASEKCFVVIPTHRLRNDAVSS
jgi:hypothetical protein